MDPLTLTELGIVGFLVTILVILQFRLFEKRGTKERQWPGHGFDAAPISPRIERLRSDYVSAVRSRDSCKGFHAQLLTSTRRAVRYLPFFRARNLEHYEERQHASQSV